MMGLLLFLRTGMSFFKNPSTHCLPETRYRINKYVNKSTHGISHKLTETEIGICLLHEA